jgi:hypothetical protein
MMNTGEPDEIHTKTEVAMIIVGLGIMAIFLMIVL